MTRDYPHNQLGNVLEARWHQWWNRANSAHLAARSLTACRRITATGDYLRGCYSECPKHRFIKTPDGEPGLNYLCATYKKFFSHVDPYMAFMEANWRISGRRQM